MPPFLTPGVLILVASTLLVYSDEIIAPEDSLVQYETSMGSEDLGNAADLMDMKMSVVTKVMKASDDKMDSRQLIKNLFATKAYAIAAHDKIKAVDKADSNTMLSLGEFLLEFYTSGLSSKEQKMWDSIKDDKKVSPPELDLVTQYSRAMRKITAKNCGTGQMSRGGLSCYLVEHIHKSMQKHGIIVTKFVDPTHFEDDDDLDSIDGALGGDNNKGGDGQDGVLAVFPDFAAIGLESDTHTLEKVSIKQDTFLKSSAVVVSAKYESATNEAADLAHKYMMLHPTIDEILNPKNLRASHQMDTTKSTRDLFSTISDKIKELTDLKKRTFSSSSTSVTEASALANRAMTASADAKKSEEAVAAYKVSVDEVLGVLRSVVNLKENTQAQASARGLIEKALAISKDVVGSSDKVKGLIKEISEEAKSVSSLELKNKSIGEKIAVINKLADSSTSEHIASEVGDATLEGQKKIVDIAALLTKANKFVKNSDIVANKALTTENKVNQELHEISQNIKSAIETSQAEVTRQKNVHVGMVTSLHDYVAKASEAAAAATKAAADSAETALMALNNKNNLLDEYKALSEKEKRDHDAFKAAKNYTDHAQAQDAATETIKGLLALLSKTVKARTAIESAEEATKAVAQICDAADQKADILATKVRELRDHESKQAVVAHVDVKQTKEEANTAKQSAVRSANLDVESLVAVKKLNVDITRAVADLKLAREESRKEADRLATASAKEKEEKLKEAAEEKKKQAAAAKLETRKAIEAAKIKAAEYTGPSSDTTTSCQQYDTTVKRGVDTTGGTVLTYWSQSEILSDGVEEEAPSEPTASVEVKMGIGGVSASDFDGSLRNALKISIMKDAGLGVDPSAVIIESITDTGTELASEYMLQEATPVTELGPGAGLKGTFVSIENMEDPSVFKARKLFVDSKGAQTKTVANVDFPMKKYMIDDVKLTNDNFAARFKGYIHVVSAGKYTFYTHSDDGSALYIDSKLVVDNNGIHGPESRKGVLRLTAGFHHIEIVSFFTWGYVKHGNGGSSLRAYWEGPGIPKQIIPADLLWTEHKEVVSTESEDTPDGALSLIQIGATMREIKNDDHFNVKELDACRCAMYCAEHTECHGFTFSGNEGTGRMCQLKGSDAELSEDADCATCQSALMPKGDTAVAVQELLAADEGEETPKQLIVNKARDGSLSEALLGTWSEEDNAWATNMLHGLGRQVSMEQLKQLVLR